MNRHDDSRTPATAAPPVAAAAIRLQALSGSCDGILYAGLPTETRSGLPLLVDASFFPSTDRKRVIFETKGADYRTEWNAAAVRAATAVLARWLGLLRTLLGPAGFWNFLLATAQATLWAKPGSSPVHGLRDLGEAVLRAAREMESAYTHDGRWVRPDRAVVLQRGAESAAIPVLADLGLAPLHPDLRVIVSQGLVSADSGLGYLTLPRIMDALADAGFRRPQAWSSAPGSLATPAGLAQLWREVRLLADAADGAGHYSRETRAWLAALAIAPTIAGDLLPPRDVYCVDSDTGQLIESLDLRVPVLDNAFQGVDGGLVNFCSQFDVAALVRFAAEADPDAWERRWRAGLYDPDLLLRWLASRLAEFSGDVTLVADVRRLRAFATREHLARLEDVVLRGDFPDPVGIANTLEAPRDLRVRALLAELSVRPLTIQEFASRQVPRALARGATDEMRRDIVAVMADNVSLLEGDDAVRHSLAKAALVECTDGQFRTASACVLDSEEARLVLGPDAALAIVPEHRERSYRHLLEWLGVAPRVTADQLRLRIEEISAGPPTSDAVDAMELVARHLDGRLQEDPVRALVQGLKEVEWLPARNDEGDWWTPADVYPLFVEYLFGSFGRVIAFSRETQVALARSLFVALGIQSAPPAALVVQHLLASAEEDRRDLDQIRQVYLYLSGDRQVGDPSLDDLRGRPSLLLPTGWVSPEDVYWESHPFGTRRHTLSFAFLVAKRCLDRIGVRERPEIDDAIGVLREIASEAADDGALSAGDLESVRGAWGLISERLAGGDADSSASDLRALADERIALDRDGRLNEPRRLYFEDRATLTDKFPVDLRMRIIPYDAEIGPALRGAGVQELGAVIRVVKLEAGEERPAEGVDKLLASRWPALRRVLEANRPQDGAAVGLSLDAFLRIESDQLVVKHELPQEPGRPATAPERPEALFLPADVLRDGQPVGALYVRSGDLPIRALARELAVALAGPRSVPAVAPGFSAVLGATSAADAEEALDDLGLARITIDELPHTAGAVVDDFGGTAPPDDKGEAPEVEEEQEAPVVDGREDAASPAASRDATPPETAGEGRLRPESAGRRDGGVAEGKQPAADGRPPQTRLRGRTHTTQYSSVDPVLRTYIPSPTTPGWELTDEQKAARTATDEAGIQAVLDYERRAGRNPRSMPHNHPGYDVRSEGPDDAVRFIEVKSTSGAWQTSQAALSREQHRVAIELGDQYWLYVVERAGLETAEIHPIQDPIGRATHFGFDPGWRDVAFDAEAPYEELEDEPNAPAAHE